MVHVCACPSMDHLLTGGDNCHFHMLDSVCVWQSKTDYLSNVRGAYTLLAGYSEII